MSKYSIDNITLTGIANAIRDKDGTTSPIVVKDFASRIRAIPSGGGDSGNIKIPKILVNGCYGVATSKGTPRSGYLVYSDYAERAAILSPLISQLENKNDYTAYTFLMVLSPIVDENIPIFSPYTSYMNIKKMFLNNEKIYNDNFIIWAGIVENTRNNTNARYYGNIYQEGSNTIGTMSVGCYSLIMQFPIFVTSDNDLDKLTLVLDSLEADTNGEMINDKMRCSDGFIFPFLTEVNINHLSVSDLDGYIPNSYINNSPTIVGGVTSGYYWCNSYQRQMQTTELGDNYMILPSYNENIITSTDNNLGIIYLKY